MEWAESGFVREYRSPGKRCYPYKHLGRGAGLRQSKGRREEQDTGRGTGERKREEGKKERKGKERKGKKEKSPALARSPQRTFFFFWLGLFVSSFSSVLVFASPCVFEQACLYGPLPEQLGFLNLTRSLSHARSVWNQSGQPQCW